MFPLASAERNLLKRMLFFTRPRRPRRGYGGAVYPMKLNCAGRYDAKVYNADKKSRTGRIARTCAV